MYSASIALPGTREWQLEALDSNASDLLVVADAECTNLESQLSSDITLVSATFFAASWDASNSLTCGPSGNLIDSTDEMIP